MNTDAAALYTALSSRDPRFDGVFFVGVTSTGIYCRPVCTARTPKAANCRFFENAGAAEKAHFRPCLRCRPELAPGHAPVDNAHRIASLIVQRIEEGMLGQSTGTGTSVSGLEHIASTFGWSTRQIRRIVHDQLGVSPMELISTRRLLLAKQLLTDTTLPIADVAISSGFSSLRRFNDAFCHHYRMPPTRFRKAIKTGRPVAESPESLTLLLSYRPPFDWPAVLRFLGARAMKSVECVARDSYSRTLQLGNYRGWIQVRHVAAQHAVSVELSHSLTPVLPALLARVRHLFDLSARPDVINAHLAQDPLLGDMVAGAPGLRVPGAFDGFELAVRAILGQQITVKGATTLAGRFTDAFGEPMATPHLALGRLSPTPTRIAEQTATAIAALGIVRVRAESITALAREVASGRLCLEPGVDPEGTMEQLRALPGIGPWTANYIAMRALRWPDAFPKEDVALRKRLGGLTAREGGSPISGVAPVAELCDAASMAADASTLRGGCGPRERLT